MIFRTETSAFVFIYALLGLLLAEGARWRMKARGKSFGRAAFTLTFLLWPLPVAINLVWLFWPLPIKRKK